MHPVHPAVPTPDTRARRSGARRRLQRAAGLGVVLLVLSPGAPGAARADAESAAERLEGVVLDAGGAPASGAAVVLKGRDGRRESPADNGGRFFLEVEPGVYLVSATAGSIASEEVRVEIRDGEAPPLLTLLLRPPMPVDEFASMPIAGRLEVFLAGPHLLIDRFETGRTPVVTSGPPRTFTTGVRLASS